MYQDVCNLHLHLILLMVNMSGRLKLLLPTRMCKSDAKRTRAVTLFSSVSIWSSGLAKMRPTTLGNQKSIARIALTKFKSTGPGMLKGLLLTRRSSVRSRLCNVFPSVTENKTAVLLVERASVRKELVQLI